MPDMIFYGTNFTTCVVKPQCLPSAYANPTFTCVPVSQGNELPVARGSSTPTALPPQTPSTTEERGDVGYIGFWRSGRETTIFDIRVTDTDAKSYLPTEVSKVLERQEKEKKGKYLTSCLEMRKDFTPLVYSVDGVAGREARSAEKRLASMLADKWKQQYSQIVYYVRVRMQIALVRSTSLLIRGSRNHRGHCFHSTPDGSALSDWQTWQDRA